MSTYYFWKKKGGDGKNKMVIFQVKKEMQGSTEYWVEETAVKEEQENKGTGK